MNRKNIVIRAAAVFMAFLLLLTSRDFLSSISAVEPEEQTGVHTHAEGCTVECAGEDCQHICDDKCQENAPLSEKNGETDISEEDIKVDNPENESISPDSSVSSDSLPEVPKADIGSTKETINENSTSDINKDKITDSEEKAKTAKPEKEDTIPKVEDNQISIDVLTNVSLKPTKSSSFKLSRSSRSLDNEYDTRYGYNHLDTAGKAAYDLLEAYYDDFHNSTRNAFTQGANNFVSNASGSPSYLDSLASVNITAEDANKALSFMRHDNPQYFSIRNAIVWYDENDQPIDVDTNPETIVASMIGVIRNDCASFSNRFTKRMTVDNALSAYLGKVSSMPNDYQKEKYFYDQIIVSTVYPTLTSSADDRDSYHNIDGVFKDKNAVCEGRAKALQMLLNASGIENIYVVGYGIQGSNAVGHAWNMAKIEGNYYNMDTTFGDVESLASSYYAPAYYTYFNANDTMFNADHIAYTDPRIQQYRLPEEPFYDIPNCISEDYYYYTVAKSYAKNSNTASTSALKNFFDEAVKASIDQELRIGNYYYAQFAGDGTDNYTKMKNYMFDPTSGNIYAESLDALISTLNQKTGTTGYTRSNVKFATVGSVILLQFPAFQSVKPKINVEVIKTLDGTETKVTEVQTGDNVDIRIKIVNPVTGEGIDITDGDLTLMAGGTDITDELTEIAGQYEASGYSIPGDAAGSLVLKASLKAGSNYQASEGSSTLTVTADTPPTPADPVVSVTNADGDTTQYETWTAMLAALTDNSSIELLSDITLSGSEKLPNKICTIKNSEGKTFKLITEGESLQLQNDLALENISITKPIFNKGHKLTLNGSVTLVSLFENLGALNINKSGNIIQAIEKEDVSASPADTTLEEGAALTAGGRFISGTLSLKANSVLALTASGAEDVHIFSGEISGSGTIKLSGNCNGINASGGISGSAAVQIEITDVINLDNYSKRVMLFAPDAGISAERFICENTGYEFKVINNGLYLLKDTYNTPTVSAKVRNEDTLSAYTGDFRQEVFFEFECSGFNSEIMKYQVSSDNGTNWLELSEITAESDTLKGKLYYDVQGEHDLNFRLVTKAGDELSTATTEAIKVKIDKVSPAFTVAATADGADYTYDVDNAVDSDVLFTFTQTAADGIASGVTYYYATSSIEADAAAGWTAITNNTFTATAESGLTNTNTYYFKAVSGSGKVVKADSSWQVNIDKTGPQPGTPIVAIEGGADYETWADMLAALQDGDVIILKQNVKLSDADLPNKSCTIKNTEGNTYKINTDGESLKLNNDLILENISFTKPVYNNGHNLTLNGSVSLSALYENVGTLTVNGADNKILALDEDAGVNAETTPDPSVNFTLADQASLSVGGSLLCKALNLGNLSELIMADNIGENAHVVHGELSGTGTIKLNGNCGGISLTGSVSDAANIHVNITDIENLDNYSSKIMSFGAELGVSAERFSCDNTGYQFKVISNSLYLLKNSYNAPAASAKVRSGDTLSAYTAGSYAQAVYFEFTCAGFNSDIMKYQVSSNGGTDWSDLSEITAEDDALKGSQYYDVQGDHNLTFRLATKGGEALSDSSAETAVKIDKTVPAFTVAATANGAEYTYDAGTATEEDVLFTFTLTTEGGVPSDVTYYYATSDIAADTQSGWTVIDGNTFTATARSGKSNTNTYYFKAVSGSGVANKDASSHSVNIQKPTDPDNPFVPVVAIKDGNEFETWEDMLAELNDGDTIVLMDDIVLDEGKLPAGSHKIVSDVNEAGTPYAVSTKNSVPINMQGDLNISKVSINAGLLNKGFKLTLSGDSYVDELFMKSGENAAVISEGDGNEIGSLHSETTGEYLDVEVNAAGGSGSLKIPYDFTSNNIKVGQGAVLMLTGDGTSVKKAEGALSGTGTIELNAAGPSLSVKGGLTAGSGLTIKVSDNKVTDLTHEVISFITDPSVSISASSFVSAHNGYALVMRESKLWFMEDLSAKAAPVVTAHVKAGENMAAYDNSYKKDIYLKFASGDFKSDTMVYQYKENAADAQWTTAVIPTSAEDGEVGYLHMTQEGEKSYVFRMASADGTNATPATGSAMTLKIDRTAPAAPSITNAGSYTDWFNANQTVTATFTQSSGSTEALHYSVDGGNTYTAGSSYTTSADGSTTVVFKLVDEAGNESTPVSVTVKVDSTIPEFTTAAKVGNENYTYNESSPVESDVTFSFTNQPVNKSGVTYYYATSDLDVSASSGWTQITGSTFNATANSGASNKNTYYFKAVSGAGLVKKSAAYKVNIEKPNFSAISVSTGSYQPGDWSKSDVTFRLSGGLPAALFDHYEVAATASNVTAAPQDGWTTVNGADGTSHKVDSDGQNKYWFRAASTGGAKGSVTSGHIVKLDKTRPVIQSAAFSQIDGETTGSITVKASDGNSGSGISKVQLAVDTVVVATQTRTDSNGNYVFDGLANGTYLVIVTDNAGNQDDGSHSVIVKLNILNSIQIQGGTDGLITLQMDQSLTKNVTAVLDPADYVGTLSWESQNTKVAQVASDGAGGAVITAKGEGFTVVKVSSANKSDTVYVKVKPKDETETGVSHNTASEITNLCKEIKDTTPKAIIMEIADEITRLPEKEQAKLSKSTLSKVEGLYEDVLEDSSFSIKVEPDEGFTPADEVAMKDADIAACGGLIAAAAGGEAPEGKNVELRISQLEPTDEKAIIEYSCKLYVGEEEKPLSSPLYLTIKLPASADTKNLIIRHFKDNGEEEVIKPSEVKNGLMTYLTTSFSSFQVMNDETAAQDPTDPGTSDPTTGDGTDGNKNGTPGGDTGTDGNGSGDGTTGTGNGTSGGQSGTGSSSQSGSNAKTGDSTNALPFIFLAAGSLAALAYALQKRKKA